MSLWCRVRAQCSCFTISCNSATVSRSHEMSPTSANSATISRSRANNTCTRGYIARDSLPDHLPRLQHQPHARSARPTVCNASMSATTVMVCKRSSWHGLEPPAPSPLTVRLFHASRKQQFARAATLLELVSMADSTDRSSCTVLLGET
jgi:hypothetical protein